MEIKELVDTFKKLDLTTYPEAEIRTLFKKMGKIGFMSTTLHPGHVIVRARPNEEKTFTVRGDLSYKPPKYNTTFQRASTPQQTMFYGGIVPPNVLKDISGNARFAPAFEASYLIRDDLDGMQTLTFSKWEVVKDIPLITICHNEDFVGKHAHTFNLNEVYHKTLKQMPVDVANRSVEMTSYLADEFAKKLNSADKDFNYMISSVFTELSLTSDNSGIYYPSVQTMGLGFNVAIAPNVVDSSLKLVGASECTIYKKGKSILVDNETTCDIIDDTQPFVLKPIDPKYRFGKEESMKRVGM
jgi:hypothetical protein